MILKIPSLLFYPSSYKVQLPCTSCLQSPWESPHLSKEASAPLLLSCPFFPIPHHKSLRTQELVYQGRTHPGGRQRNEIKTGESRVLFCP